MRCSSRYSLAGALLLVVGATALHGQQITTRDVFVGTRVRVYAPSLRSERFVGRVDSLDAVNMVMDTTGARRRLGFDTGPVLVDEYRRVRLQLAAIERIEASGGRTVKKSTIRGLVIGALGGGLLWGLGNLPEVNPTLSGFLKEMPTGLVVGGLIGGGVGYALGDERWFPARIPR
ncbi:MAG: hypothetical protein MNPFHGCM_02375 [Gemmatimonadaceae bacterium]|nr:hypothetical protein [Gemmatimonadaceae bacterium]